MMVVSHPTPYSPDLAPCDFFVPGDESGIERDTFTWRAWGSTRIAGGTLAAYLLPFLDSVSSSESDAGIAASSLGGGLWGGKVSNLYDYLYNF
jgi:hypothetical protein